MNLLKRLKKKTIKQLLSEKRSRFGAFVNNDLRDYQKDSFVKSLKYNSGQYLLPTGTGKTYIQKTIHANIALENESNSKFSTCVIVAHRLLLCRQLLGEIEKFFQELDLEYEVIFVGSGNNDLTGTTNEKEIKNRTNKIKKQKKHVIIISTYHSFDKLSLLDKIDICTFDEAHNIVTDDPKNSGQFRKNIELIKP